MQMELSLSYPPSMKQKKTDMYVYMEAPFPLPSLSPLPPSPPPVPRDVVLSVLPFVYPSIYRKMTRCAGLVT